MTKTDAINWNVTKTDHNILSGIAHRAVLLFPAFSQHETMMDLTACHANGCPLRLKDLLNANEFDFSHDILGIRQHLDRSTGKLTNFFRPRYAR